jgi:hypothetical protein
LQFLFFFPLLSWQCLCNRHSLFSGKPGTSH